MCEAIFGTVANDRSIFPAGTLATCHDNAQSLYLSKMIKKVASLSASHQQKVSTHYRFTPKVNIEVKSI